MISFTFNSETLELDVVPDMPLLWVIREHLNLTGTKFGCGKGLCGACTVHMDGAPIRSCLKPISEVAGRAITTIEGANEIAAMTFLRRAWIENNVPQCGYCQTGQLMSAAALLTQNAQPSDVDVDDAMSGNICRCGTYPRIRKAIHHAAQLMASSNTISAQSNQGSEADAGKAANFTNFVELKIGSTS